MLLHSIKWLRANEAARLAACSSVWVHLNGKAPPDAIAADPAILVHFAKALVVEAVARDAPDAAIDELLGMLRRMAAGAKQLHRHRYAASVLKKMQGLRQDDAVVAALDEGLRGAPDEASRRTLAAMLRTMHIRSKIDWATVMDDDEDESASRAWCLICCEGACLWCVQPAEPLVTCGVCCVGGCLLCQID